MIRTGMEWFLARKDVSSASTSDELKRSEACILETS